jgi:hypothetical protein
LSTTLLFHDANTSVEIWGKKAISHAIQQIVPSYVPSDARL